MEVKVLVFADDMISKRLMTMMQDDNIKLVGRTYDENSILDNISKAKPDIVVLSSSNTSMLLRVCQQIYLLRPRSIPVVVTEDYTPESIQKIVQTGVHYVLPMNIDMTTLNSQLKGIKSNESTRMTALENSGTSNWKSKVITVFSTKGGVGKTSLAVNLAIKLAQKRRKVAILDFNMEFGDVASFLRIDSKDNISTLLEEQPSLNTDTIRKYMAVHSSGIGVLQAPSSPEYAINISASSVEKVISSLRTHYDYLIIDTAVGFNSINLSAFDASSQVLFVTGMDLSTLKNTKKGLVILNSLIGAEKIKVVIGKEEPSRVKLKDLGRALEMEVWHSIAYDQKIALEAINLGKPIVSDSPMSKTSKDYQVLANMIDESEDDGDGVESKESSNPLEKIIGKLGIGGKKKKVKRPKVKKRKVKKRRK